MRPWSRRTKRQPVSTRAFLPSANRVVIAAWGAKRSPPVRTPPVDLDKIPEVRVLMRWDDSTRSVRRKIGDREFADDAELQKAIADAHDAWTKQGKPDAPVTIDADGRVPWNQVIDVVNIIKRCGINKIEFAMGTPPKKTPK